MVDRGGRADVRVQLQCGHRNLWSAVPPDISAHATIATLQRMASEMGKHFKDKLWPVELRSAVGKAVGIIQRMQVGGGYVPRGSGTAVSVKFDYNRETFRIDIETHGDKEADWFN